MRKRKGERPIDRSKAHPEWSKLLVEAVREPGVISTAYSQFWNYSVGNQLLALFECMQRGIEPGPIHTFVGWQELGRHVKEGERALTLCMPIKVKTRGGSEPRSAESDTPNDVDTASNRASGEEPKVTVFVYRARWFVLSQTDGKAYVPTEVPAWSESQALLALKIERVPFRHTDGNCQGYARDRQVAVSPIAFLPHRTLFHELAHVVLGHTKESALGMSDADEQTPRDIREVEAESVALLCCQSLGLPGAEFSRGYVQHWLAGQTITDKSTQKIFKAADDVLRAGRPPISTADRSPEPRA